MIQWFAETQFELEVFVNYLPESRIFVKFNIKRKFSLSCSSINKLIFIGYVNSCASIEQLGIKSTCNIDIKICSGENGDSSVFTCSSCIAALSFKAWIPSKLSNLFFAEKSSKLNLPLHWKYLNLVFETDLISNRDSSETTRVKSNIIELIRATILERIKIYILLPPEDTTRWPNDIPRLIEVDIRQSLQNQQLLYCQNKHT